MDIPDKILIVGLGASGISVARFLGGTGKTITLTDEKDESALAKSLAALKGIGYKGSFGGHRREDFLSHPLIVISPGVDSELPLLKEARAAGATVVGEIELAYAFTGGETIIAVTGTNGKTTTTTVIGQLFEKAFGSVFVGGNIGNPLMDYIIAGKKASYLVLEISSFQLETINRFHADTAILLNVTEDHLDRYRSYVDYMKAKYRIFDNQHEKDFAVLNTNLVYCGKIKSKKLFFSTQQIVAEGAYSVNGTMHVRINGKEYVYQRNISPLYGIHNTENLLATILVAHIYGIEQGLIEEVLRSFRGLPHRVELVREVKKIKFFNDSKATNVDATKRALEGMTNPVVLIAGGKDKGGSYEAIRRFKDRIKALVLIGEAKDHIRQELGETFKTYFADNLQSAVEQSIELAGAGDIVLFSPMCSSFDMFADYRHRGTTFRRIVESL